MKKSLVKDFFYYLKNLTCKGHKVRAKVQHLVNMGVDASLSLSNNIKVNCHAHMHGFIHDG